MLIGDKKIDGIILGQVISTSGKYKIFFLTHFNGKQACWDVGVFNNKTGEVTRRHYSDKVEALAYWEEFSTKMTEKGGLEEREEQERIIIH